VRIDVRFDEARHPQPDDGNGFSAREAAKAGRPFQRFDARRGDRRGLALPSHGAGAAHGRVMRLAAR